MNVVFSDFVSARSLKLGLKMLGEDLRAWGCGGSLVERADREPLRGDRLFFTDESWLGRYLDRAEEFSFHPRSIGFPLDDKLAFSRAVQACGGDPVPFWELSELAQIHDFPVMLKGRRSWIGSVAHPRGRLCVDADDVERALCGYESKGFHRDGFFLQRWFPDGVRNCWSVSGWSSGVVDGGDILLVTRKLAATRGGLGYSLVVGTEPDPAGLRDRARRLLAERRYQGPFELEFLQDPLSGVFHELELNPRFWLQHSIFVRFCGNSLLRRYLGMPLQGSGVPKHPVLWVSGIGTLIALAKPWRRDIADVLVCVKDCRRRGGKVLVDPPLPVAFKLLFTDLCRRVGGLFHPRSSMEGVRR